MKRRPHSLHYCGWCKSTTRHTENEITVTCIRCGLEKHVTRNNARGGNGRARSEA